MAQENEVTMTPEIIDEAALAEELASISLPDEKISIDWKAVGIGALGAIAVGGLIYGGYKGYKYFKAKKDEEKNQQQA